jgi:hypothetical protein
MPHFSTIVISVDEISVSFQITVLDDLAGHSRRARSIADKRYVSILITQGFTRQKLWS